MKRAGLRQCNISHDDVATPYNKCHIYNTLTRAKYRSAASGVYRILRIPSTNICNTYRNLIPIEIWNFNP
jgi:hypothetical protein